MKDLVIIGAAATGCAAAVYAARRHLDFTVIAQDIGGEVARSGEVENWPGIIHTTGIELAGEFRKHVESYGVDMQIGYSVTGIEQKDGYHVVSAKNSAGEELVIETKTVIIGTGIHPKKLNIPGEDEFKGKGVTYCTVCDGPLFKGKTTTTVGAGSAALESALMLSDIAKTVNLITIYKDEETNQGGFPRGEAILIKKVKEKKNINIFYNALSTEIIGDGRVTHLKYKDKDTDEEHEIPTDGVMVHIGTIPNSDFIDCVEKNGQGEIMIDLECKTSCKGIFAGGDVTNIPHKQISISAGHGATAALTAIDYINKFES